MTDKITIDRETLEAVLATLVLYANNIRGDDFGEIEQAKVALRSALAAQPASAQRLSDEQIMQIWDKHAAMAPAGSRRLAVGRAIEAAIVPPGYVVVPVEPSYEMAQAYLKAQREASLRGALGMGASDPKLNFREGYRAMIAAAKDKP